MEFPLRNTKLSKMTVSPSNDFPWNKITRDILTSFLGTFLKRQMHEIPLKKMEKNCHSHPDEGTFDWNQVAWNNARPTSFINTGIWFSKGNISWALWAASSASQALFESLQEQLDVATRKTRAAEVCLKSAGRASYLTSLKMIFFLWSRLQWLLVPFSSSLIPKHHHTGRGYCIEFFTCGKLNVKNEMPLQISMLSKYSVNVQGCWKTAICYGRCFKRLQHFHARSYEQIPMQSIWELS